MNEIQKLIKIRIILVKGYLSYCTVNTCVVKYNLPRIYVFSQQEPGREIFATKVLCTNMHAKSYSWKMSTYYLIERTMKFH